MTYLNSPLSQLWQTSASNTGSPASFRFSFHLPNSQTPLPTSLHITSGSSIRRVKYEVIACGETNGNKFGHLKASALFYFSPTPPGGLSASEFAVPDLQHGPPALGNGDWHSTVTTLALQKSILRVASSTKIALSVPNVPVFTCGKTLPVS